MAKYRVTKPKAYDGDKEVKVGTEFEADEVPAFLVGKVELVAEPLAEEPVEDEAAKKAAEEAAKKAATDPAKK